MRDASWRDSGDVLGSCCPRLLLPNDTARPLQQGGGLEGPSLLRDSRRGLGLPQSCPVVRPPLLPSLPPQMSPDMRVWSPSLPLSLASPPAPQAFRPAHLEHAVLSWCLISGGFERTQTPPCQASGTRQRNGPFLRPFLIHRTRTRGRPVKMPQHPIPRQPQTPTGLRGVVTAVGTLPGSPCVAVVPTGQMKNQTQRGWSPPKFTRSD